ncbi:MAG: type VI secretion system baseplate subunit TssE [Desulfobacterales bacterium]|nr:type VI secretion system baseplate subunit TssE [Desulfobacterales bacterium]
MSFFDRFRQNHSGGQCDHGIRGIVSNLSHILNTRQAFGSFLSGYGIRDMNEYSSRDQLSLAIMEEIRFNIESYEKRVELIDISVEDISNPFRLAFKLECRVKETHESLLMEFNSVSKNLNVKNFDDSEKGEFT